MRHLDVVLRSFDEPDETRHMDLGRFDIVTLHGHAYGRAIYQPGWQWSKHLGPARGARWCEIEHIGLVLSGAAAVAFEDGSTIELEAGAMFYVPRLPHDSWVIGDVPYVSLHLLGAEGYAK